LHIVLERTSWQQSVVTVGSEVVGTGKGSVISIFRNWETDFIDITDFVRRMFLFAVSTLVALVLGNGEGKESE